MSRLSQKWHRRMRHHFVCFGPTQTFWRDAPHKTYELWRYCIPVGRREFDVTPVSRVYQRYGPSCRICSELRREIITTPVYDVLATAKELWRRNQLLILQR